MGAELLAAAALLALVVVGWRCHRWLSDRRAGRADVSDALTLDGGHRVASTLQMILSLLRVHEHRLRSNAERPEAAAAALRAAQERISTVAIVHRELHQVAEAGAAEMERLLWMVTDTLVVGANLDRPVGITVECGPMTLPSRHAIPVALMVGEWTTHRLARAPAPSVIQIGLRAEEELHVLEYGDDGAPWDAGLDDGMLHAEVIGAMVRQLSGTLIHGPGRGVRLRLTFPGLPISACPEG